MLYNIWGFVRQSAVRIYLAGAKAIYKISGGKLPKSLYCKRANPEKIGTDVKIISENDYSTTIAKVDENGNIKSDDFVIVSTTDFHFDVDHEINTKAVKNFVQHIKDIKPDLVVLTGDNILSKYQQIDAIQFAQMMEEIGIYWTAVFGNHETREDRGFYKWLLFKSFCDYEHCLCKFGPDDMFGYGNFTVNILDGKVCFTLAVRKKTKLFYLVSHFFGNLFCIFVSHPKKNNITFADFSNYLSVNLDRRLGNSLQYNLHNTYLS